MLANLQSIFAISICLLIAFWSIPSKHNHARALTLFIGSLFILAIISVEALLAAIVIYCFALILLKIQFAVDALNGRGFSGIVFLPLVAFSLLDFFPELTHSVLSWQTIGLSYYSLKLYSLMRDSLKSGAQPKFHDTLVFVFFYPIFSVGPIENIQSLNAKVLSTRFDINEFMFGLYRLALGIFKVVFLAESLLGGILEGFPETALLTSWQAWSLTISSFLYLYLNFSGFSDLAIGMSRLYGINIRENFNHPYKAKTVQEFWQRWHMSLGSWVSKYLFFPLVRNNGKPFISVLVVFLLMGLWHHFSWNYVIWGLAHGLAMGMAREFPRLVANSKSYDLIKTTHLYSTLLRILTLLFVAIASKFANFESLAEATVYLGKLI